MSSSDFCSFSFNIVNITASNFLNVKDIVSVNQITFVAAGEYPFMDHRDNIAAIKRNSVVNDRAVDSPVE